MEHRLQRVTRCSKGILDQIDCARVKRPLRANDKPAPVEGEIVLAARLAQRSQRHHDPRRRMPLMG
jgi:hypothetical protein